MEILQSLQLLVVSDTINVCKDAKLYVFQVGIVSEAPSCAM